MLRELHVEAARRVDVADDHIQVFELNGGFEPGLKLQRLLIVLVLILGDFRFLVRGIDALLCGRTGLPYDRVIIIRVTGRLRLKSERKVSVREKKKRWNGDDE